MTDLTTDFAGIRSPNPFWLASGPPTNTAGQVMRAFDAGWGGAIWKTVGEPIVNTTSRYGGIDLGREKLMGFNNIELISDRSIEDNLREIAEVKRRYPKNAVVVSLMVDSKRTTWHEMVKRSEDTGCDGLELNFGCPHGMSERGMGAAVGQVPEYTTMITEWVKEVARTPVIVKLTPNVTDVTRIAVAAEQGGADAISLINTINSLMGVDLDTFAPRPTVRGKGSHGGYCGPAVKPIALNMVAACAKHVKIPISGIGGIATWRDAAEFITVGARSVQVCTAAMHYGFRIVEDMIDGLGAYLDAKGFAKVGELEGRAIESVTDWGNLDLNYKIVAQIDAVKCIGCHLCYIACEDGAHQCIEEYPRLSGGQNGGINGGPNGGSNEGKGNGATRVPRIIEEDCVGCNLCALVCPVEGCITMKEVDTGQPAVSWNERVRRQQQEAGVAYTPSLWGND